MNTKKKPERHINSIIVIAVVVALLAPLGYSFVTYIFAQDSQSFDEFLVKPDAQYENCVKETDYMRFHHWELLREVREEVVRHGKRGELGLDRCADCHTDRSQFCDKCHNVANVMIDCFNCHYYPETPDTTPGESH